MLKTYKIEIKPTEEQRIKIAKTIGVCRYVYNFYLSKNKKEYEERKKFISGYSFSKWLNNEFIPNNESFMWIKQVSSKAVKQSIMNAEKSYKNFFKKKAKFPRFKKKSDTSVKIYLPKNNKTDWSIERHRIKIPTLGFMRLKEFGYISTDSMVKSGTVSKYANKYYVAVLVEEKEINLDKKYTNEKIGCDLGIKDFLISSDGRIFKNVNKTSKVKKLEKRLRRKQRTFSRKVQANKKGNNIVYTTNMRKTKDELAVIHFKLKRIRHEYVRFVVNSLVKANSLPEYISIEDLNIKGMLKNRHLSDSIRKQNFYYFREYLIQRCKKYDVEVRLIDRWYPSSKKCHQCGNIKKDLTLSDRIYKCDCGYIEDRDVNASLNIRDCDKYSFAY